MPLPPTLAVYAVVPDGARSAITSVGGDAVTIHPCGALCQPSLHFSTLEELEAWHHDLGQRIADERTLRVTAREAIAEMRTILRRIDGGPMCSNANHGAFVAAGVLCTCSPDYVPADCENCGGSGADALGDDCELCDGTGTQVREFDGTARA